MRSLSYRHHCLRVSCPVCACKVCAGQSRSTERAQGSNVDDTEFPLNASFSSLQVRAHERRLRPVMHVPRLMLLVLVQPTQSMRQGTRTARITGVLCTASWDFSLRFLGPGPLQTMQQSLLRYATHSCVSPCHASYLMCAHHQEASLAALQASRVSRGDLGCRLCQSGSGRLCMPLTSARLVPLELWAHRSLGC